MTSSRTYEKTHPWLSFTADLRKFSHEFWMTLGECQSKCEHIAGVPLQPSTASELHRLYLAKGVLATTAIEGNTLSEEQVLQHLDGKLELPRSREYLKHEIDNIINACNKMLKEINSNSPPKLTRQRIVELNRMVLDNLALDEGVVAGEIRKTSVGVARYRGAPAEDCAHLLDRLSEWLDAMEFGGVEGREIAFAILKSILAHLYLAWIHPFGDGNGRTARLLEFQILICSGVPAPAAHLLSNHYNATRTEYYRQLDAASRTGGDIRGFVTYAVEGLRDGLIAQLATIREQQLNVAWENYVHDAFKNKRSASDKRRRDLVLDLSKSSEPIVIGELSKISPGVASAYAGKSEKTMMRDVAALVEMDLLKRTKEGKVGVRREKILAFLPTRAQSKAKQ
ncbi:MAG TPA: Fic family protein [Candidatus Acidoferrum sp.]|nr:Fic family protein [Candidatus Acidoferrum sp.]